MRNSYTMCRRTSTCTCTCTITIPRGRGPPGWRRAGASFTWPGLTQQEWYDHSSCKPFHAYVGGRRRAGAWAPTCGLVTWAPSRLCTTTTTPGTHHTHTHTPVCMHPCTYTGSMQLQYTGVYAHDNYPSYTMSYTLVCTPVLVCDDVYCHVY